MYQNTTVCGFCIVKAPQSNLCQSSRRISHFPLFVFRSLYFYLRILLLYMSWHSVLFVAWADTDVPTQIHRDVPHVDTQPMSWEQGINEGACVRDSYHTKWQGPFANMVYEDFYGHTVFWLGTKFHKNMDYSLTSRKGKKDTVIINLVVLLFKNKKQKRNSSHIGH